MGKATTTVCLLLAGTNQRLLSFELTLIEDLLTAYRDCVEGKLCMPAAWYLYNVPTSVGCVLTTLQCYLQQPCSKVSAGVNRFFIASPQFSSYHPWLLHSALMVSSNNVLQ